MELRDKNKVKILLDPLSHGDNMTSCLIECEVLACSSDVALENEDGDEVNIEVAVIKILSGVETEWGNEKVVVAPTDNWKPEELVGHIESLVRVTGGEWYHTDFQVPVDFVKEEEVK